MSDTNSQDSFDNFDYIPTEYDDLESVAFAESLTSESVIESVGSDNSILNYDIEMPFPFNNVNFDRARTLIEEDENSDMFLLNDINDSTNIDTEVDADISTTSIFDLESTTSGSTDGSEYFVTDDTDIKSTSESLSKCPLIDIIDGSIRCCSEHTKKQRPLSQLIGVWEINSEIFQEAQLKNDLSKIGVCYSHFLYDHNQLHNANIKQASPIEKSWIYCRRCLFCNKYKHFFSRGGTCIQHSKQVFGKNIQIPCVGLKVCPIFKQKIESENISDNNDQKAKYRPRYICSECFNSHGGHFNERQGRGHVNYECKDRHKNDTSEALRIIGCWILSMAGTNDENNKNNLLTCLTNMLLTYHNIKSSVVVNYPSLFFIKMALRLLHIDITKIMNHQYKITPETANEFGKTLGNVTWRTRHDVEKNKTKLENPSSLTEYQNGFPSFLTDFFNGFIETLQRKKYEILTRKRKQRGLSLKNFDTSCVNKITVFLTSMILNIAFPNTKIWLTHIMSSLCRNPKLHHSLYNILCIANVVSHTYRYERLLEKARQQVVSPESRLLRNTNIWNISVIDNIDFIEQTYAYGNIFDTTRRSVHATLRMVFQFTLPMQIQHCSPINIKAFNGNNLSIFGTSDFTNNLLSLYEEMFQNFLTTRADDWDADNILKEIAQKIPMGCKVPHPNVVILKPGDNPNCNVNVHNACDMYYGDVGIVNTGCLDIACDEAIFRRLISYKDDNIDKNVRPLLGQWHTSRDMCIVLINVFSGYGIANMAAKLGVRFLDKLEKVVDYQATCRVLELIWVAVGIAIFKYLNNKNLTISDIKSGNNNILKVWYHYLCWAGYWIGHKIGIRRGNYEMQIRNLKAFSPLFPVTGKSNYARSVVYFLTYVEHDPHLQELLKCVCSVNLTQPGHYFAFDEALERFGVKFVKQNIGGKIVSDEELSLQISSVQTERERLDLLISEYIGDTVVVREERAVQSRKEVLWQLANELLSAFSLEDPKMHDIFLNAPEITSIGFSKLFTCYDNGIPRLIDIQKQDVYQKVSRNTIGRRKHDVGVHKLSENQSKEMRKQRINRNLTVDQVEDNTTEQQEGLATEHKRQYRITKDNEKEILENLFKSKSDSFPQDEAIEVLRQLQDSSKDWNMQRVRNYWNNHHKRK